MRDNLCNEEDILAQKDAKHEDFLYQSEFTDYSAKLTIYAPLVFTHLRNILGISNPEFINVNIMLIKLFYLLLILLIIACGTRRQGIDLFRVFFQLQRLQ